MPSTRIESLRKTRLVRSSLIALVASILFCALWLVPRATLQESAKKTGRSLENFRAPDEVTRAVRDESNKIVRIDVHNVVDRRAAAGMGELIADYGSFVVIAADKNKDFSGLRLANLQIETTINLPGSVFEPVNDARAETIAPDAGGANAANGGKDYYIVQFAAPARDEWLESLRAAGVEVLQYVPHQAFFVYGDGETIQKVAAHSRVRWVGRYLAADKIAPELIDEIAAKLSGARSSGKLQSLEIGPNGKAVFDIAIFARANLGQAQATLRGLSGGGVMRAIRLPNNFFNVVRVELPLYAVARVALMPDVVRIDPYYTPTKEDERAAMIIAGNYTSTTTISPPGYNPLTQFGVNGQNVTVAVVDDGVGIPGDGGFYVTATNTVNGPLRGATVGAQGHGHINASIIAGTTPFSATLDPTGYNYGLGIAPNANIINIPLLRTGYTGNEAITADDTVSTNGANGVKGFVSNNSWGSGTNGNSYDSYAAQFDGFVQDASAAASIDPILLVFSAGNSGALGLTRPKMAKNLIAVANSENLRTELSASANNIDDLNSGSSRGPAADGRIKPDITAPGTAISGGRSGTDALFGNIDTFHRWSTGTSHAAPQVAGAAALFTQFWKNGNGGVNPSPALAKAAIINTGQEMNGIGTNTSTIPNGNEGWGRINMKLMLNTGVPIKYVNQTVEFSDPGNSSTYMGKVSDVTKPVRISLVWTDPPGVSNPALVNDLDLTVTVGANTYKGNVFTGGVSTTGGVADNKNNVENVFLAAGVAAGTAVTIQVTATAINGNGILGNADATDQHFALVAYNFNSAGRAKPSDFDGDGKSDIAVFRPPGGEWYISQSSNGAFRSQAFGISTDIIVPADYDGDSKTDIAVFRPSSGAWYYLQSSNSTFVAQSFGVMGDVPAPADYDGDGKADIAVFRPSDGVWYLSQSTAGFKAQQFGTSGDVPVAGDYDGDNKADVAVYRPSGGAWYITRSSDSGFVSQQFGVSTDKPVVGDYDVDGKYDFAVYRPSNGGWYVLQSSNGSFVSQQFGTTGDIPAPGDYDGDNKWDLGVFRPSGGVWYLLQSTAGFKAQQFGASGDRPVPSAYVP